MSYKVKGKNKEYATPFDLMEEEDVVQVSGNDVAIVAVEKDGEDMTFYDFVKTANEVLCKNCTKSENSSGYSAQNASSGDYVKNASSGDSAQNASSGDYAQNASSGDSAQNASSGDYAQNASSGDYAQNASSGDYAQNASSGDNAKNASSGDYAQNASSGDYAKNASSGDYAQNASSGDSAQNASSGDYAQNASSGDYAQNASSGDYAQNASSGDYAQNASSGDYAQNASSGDYAQNASSGDYAQNASSGDNAKNASSGDYVKNASSGYYAQNASSGYYAKNSISGLHSVAVDCGFFSITKGIKGTLIALTSYKKIKNKNGDEKIMPKKIVTATVGKNGIKENQYYMAIGTKLYPVESIDGMMMLITGLWHKVGTYEVCAMEKIDTNNYFAINNKWKPTSKETVYVAKKGDLTAHGKTVKEAIIDVDFKYAQSLDATEHINRVKAKGTVNPNDYRLITGACKYGTDCWLKENGFDWDDEKPISEVIELTKEADRSELFRQRMGV